jgi:hypothetical protein
MGLTRKTLLPDLDDATFFSLHLLLSYHGKVQCLEEQYDCASCFLVSRCQTGQLRLAAQKAAAKKKAAASIGKSRKQSKQKKSARATKQKQVKKPATKRQATQVARHKQAGTQKSAKRIKDYKAIATVTKNKANKASKNKVTAKVPLHSKINSRKVGQAGRSDTKKCKVVRLHSQTKRVRNGRKR